MPGERIDTGTFTHIITVIILVLLPEGTENTKEQLEDKARNGDVVAMAALGNCYYESSNLPLAFRYFASADQASTSPLLQMQLLIL